MKTDDLISMLSTNVERVDRGQVVRNVSSILVGTAAALVAMLFVHGVRTDLSKVSTFIYLPLKLVFTMGTLVLTAIALTKLARPGGERTTPVALVALPFLMIMLLAAISVAAAPSSHWKNMIVGHQSLECLLSIPIIAIVPFAVIIWALRQTAPTDLARTGALGGLVAGAVSAHRLRVSLRRRLAAFRCALVWRDHNPLHLGRCIARSPPLALVSPTVTPVEQLLSRARQRIACVAI